MTQVELWGGVECTVNRTGDDYHDQCDLGGHDRRLTDLDRFAEAGIRAIRYPILWERVAPTDPDAPDWRWSDERLGRLHDLGIRPIAGLVHHGSGPRYTNLLDGGFASWLGRYAAQVAERYPWIEDWTPINEPVTTARFSALYGHWYPHRRDEASFWLALVNQVDGIRAAMSAVRLVNPTARLIQTDDLGRTYATVALAEQAAFDNMRRWAGWDLLFGRVTQDHPLWERLRRFGLGERLRRIAADPCPPDVVGVNHYLTSDRFLDHRLQRYPGRCHGGNGRLAYADVEAVRVLDPPAPGLAGALDEAWRRYAVPLAVTEVHNGCTRDEQLRWAAEAWDTAAMLRRRGVDVCAVTAWSLLGSHGWNTLLTSPGRYEPGVFDCSSGRPRPTALASLWRGLPTGAQRHPVAAQPGWWRRPQRLLHRPLARPAATSSAASDGGEDTLLICGASGTLGQAFARACDTRGIRHLVTGRSALDLEDDVSIAAVLDRVRPWGVVNAAGWVRVDEAEDAEAACHRVNATGAVDLAKACAARGVGCLNISSDLVFDGMADRAYVETDLPAPLGAYGRSKLAMENGCDGLAGVLVVRTAAFFSPFDRHNFAAAVADALGHGRRFVAAGDHMVSPTYLPALVDAALDLLIDGVEGIWHLAGDEALSWADFARRIATACGHDADRVDAVAGATLGWRAPRPRYAALASVRGPMPDSLGAAIEAFAQTYNARHLIEAETYDRDGPGRRIVSEIRAEPVLRMSA